MFALFGVTKHNRQVLTLRRLQHLKDDQLSYQITLKGNKYSISVKNKMLTNFVDLVELAVVITARTWQSAFFTVRLVTRIMD